MFIGYAFGDQNVEFLFDNICKKLGEFKKECFLAVPDLPKYKINILSKRNINYLNIKAEELMNLIENDIRKKLIEDCKNQKIPIKKAKNILTNYGVDFELMTEGSDIFLNDIKVENHSLKGNIEINLRNKDKEFIAQMNQFNNIIKGETIEPTVLNGKYLKKINTSVKDIDLPIFDGMRIERMYVKPLPQEEFDCEIVSVEKDIILNGKFKRYILKDKIIIKIETILGNIFEIFDISNGYIYDKDLQVKIQVKINKISNNYIEEINGTQVMIDWMLNKKIIVYKKDDYKKKMSLLMLGNDNKDGNDFINYMYMRKSICKNLKIIERCFGINFKTINNNINKEQFDLISKLAEIGQTRKLRLDNISLKTKDGNVNIKEQDLFLLESNSNENMEIEIFGEKIRLGNCKIKCEDAYISNYMEFINKKSSEMIIKSKSDNLYAQYGLDYN